jgi:hypothetical protein
MRQRAVLLLGRDRCARFRLKYTYYRAERIGNDARALTMLRAIRSRPLTALWCVAPQSRSLPAVASARGETSPVAPSWGTNLRAIRVPVRKYTAVSPNPRSAERIKEACKRDLASCTVERPASCTVEHEMSH